MWKKGYRYQSTFVMLMVTIYGFSVASYLFRHLFVFLNLPNIYRIVPYASIYCEFPTEGLFVLLLELQQI